MLLITSTDTDAGKTVLTAALGAFLGVGGLGLGDWETGGLGDWERKVRSWGFPCLVSPFLTGNPSKGEPQVEHLFKTELNTILTSAA